jgi:predicted Zn finger-like uncharacterized protein
MAGATVQCPKCEKTFRIADRKLLGRTGKCSSCGNRFALQEAPAAAPPRDNGAPPARKPAAPSPAIHADTVSSLFPLAPTALSAPAAKAGKPSPEPLVGVNARWVPNDPDYQPQIVRSPRPPVEPSPSDVPSIFGGTTQASTATAPPFAASADDDQPPSPSENKAITSERRRKKQKHQRLMLGGIALAAAGIIAAVLLMPKKPDPIAGPGETGVTPADASASNSPGDNLPYSREMLEGNLALLDEFRPTKGQPIGMQYVPNGVNLVVHLRPAELWGSDRAAAELRASLTEGVVSWLEAAIKKHCRREPSQVEQATFVFILGAFGTQPQTGVVVRLKEPEKQSALVDEFKGRLFDESAQTPITTSGEFAYVLVDTKTFAIAPAITATELQDSLSEPNGYVSRNVDDLLKSTDRDRLLTVVADLPDLRRHIDMLFAAPARAPVTAFLDWLGEDVETIAWSIHARPLLHSEIALKPTMGIAPPALRKSLREKLDSLPEQMVTLSRGLNPRQHGFRQMVGRFPAMIEAVRESTILHVGPHDVRATTVLPAKAAPNLALAALLTWDEQRRGGSSAPAQTVAANAAGPTKVADRLKMEIDAEFKATPIEQAVIYVGDSVGVKFIVDGEALRQKGYTRNMPQTMSLGKVPAIKALKAMVDAPNQNDLAIYADEANGTAVLTTKVALEQAGKKPLPLE